MNVTRGEVPGGKSFKIEFRIRILTVRSRHVLSDSILLPRPFYGSDPAWPFTLLTAWTLAVFDTFRRERRRRRRRDPSRHLLRKKQGHFSSGPLQLI